MYRREWIKKTGVASLSGLFASPLLGDTTNAYDAAVLDIVGQTKITKDSRVELHAPTDAANGAVVPVGVVSQLPDTQSIVLLVTKHHTAKVIELDTSHPALQARLSTHLQLTQATTITALVKTTQGWFSNSTDVDTLGESCEK